MPCNLSSGKSRSRSDLALISLDLALTYIINPRFLVGVASCCAADHQSTCPVDCYASSNGRATFWVLPSCYEFLQYGSQFQISDQPRVKFDRLWHCGRGSETGGVCLFTPAPPTRTSWHVLIMRANNSNCVIYKLAVTAVCLCTILLLAIVIKTLNHFLLI